MVGEVKWGMEVRMTAKAREWRYFVSRTNDGVVLEIVRRSFDGVTYGPFVQAENSMTTSPS